MVTLHKKLLRDLFRLRYQVLTIALLVGCGIASFVAAVAASASMSASRDAFYADTRFADVFASLTRAPRSLLDRIRDIPGVAGVDGRVAWDVRLELDGGLEPVAARLVSLAWPLAAHLNQIKIRQGRTVAPGSAEEVVISEAFADAWSLEPGDSLVAILDQRRAVLRVVGIAVEPEFAFAADARTGMPDARHFGIVWMDETALAKATDMVGAFDDVVIRAGARADVDAIMQRVDTLLAPYGGRGSITRADQHSAKLVDQKIAQLWKLAKTLPVIFLGVSVFLLNVLLSRIVGTQRDQVATLKALGYRTRELGAHYLELAVWICGLGIVFGTALGLGGAHALLLMYARYFKFPAYLFRFDASSIAAAAAAALASGIAGTMFAVRRAVTIPPAEAMRPEAPPSYDASWLDPLLAMLPPVARMVLRDMQRRPWRLLLSAGSIALATSIVVAGGAFGDSLELVLRLQFETSHREQITVTLTDARPERAVRAIASLPGVINAEGERMVPVRLHAGHRSRTTAILGLHPHMDLHRLLDVDQRALSVPASGLSLSRTLAERLGVKSGDAIEVELLESDQRTIHMPVAALVDDLLGMSGYMDARALAEVLREAPRVNVILAAVEARDLDRVTQRLNALPTVATVSRPSLDRGLVRAQVADVFSVMSALLALFAAAIAVGVVYNNARIALELRSRDLATMRILGFTRAELAAVLLSEQAVQVVLGVVAGLPLGHALGGLWMSTIDRELLRIPLRIAPASYAAAVCVVALAALISALSARRRADHLDLVAVLKARD